MTPQTSQHQKQVVNLSAEPMLLNPEKKGETEVIWTYDVMYKSSPVRWSTRWDAYLQSADDAQVSGQLRFPIPQQLGTLALHPQNSSMNAPNPQNPNPKP
jgi:hypothetical protein